MKDAQFLELKKTIDDALRVGIQTHVNGKIQLLTMKIDEYIKDDLEYRERQQEWRDAITPAIEKVEKISNFSQIGIILLKTLVIMGSATTAIYAFIKYLKN